MRISDCSSDVCSSDLKLATSLRGLYLFLLNKWYFDELYDWLFVNPARRIGHRLWKEGDGAVIDGVGPDGIAATTIRLARRASPMQTGYVYHYAFAMLIEIGRESWRERVCQYG